MQGFLSAISQLAEEKGLSREKVFETVEHALASAYKKEYGKRGQIIKAKINPKTGETDFWREKIVVDDATVYIPENTENEEEEELEIKQSYRPMEDELNVEEGVEEEGARRIKYNPERHVLIEEIKKTNPELEPGQELIIPLEQKEGFGRIAAQTAKQVVLQKIREAEKETILAEYKSKEGEIVSGIVQRIEGVNVYFDIGKSLGILPKEEQIRGEFYKEGQRLKLYVLKVDTTPKGPIIYSFPGLSQINIQAF